MDPARLQLLLIATAFLCVGVTLHRMRIAELEIERLRRRHGFGLDVPEQSEQLAAVRESLYAIRNECLHASDGHDAKGALARIAREAEIALAPLDPELEPLPPAPAAPVDSPEPANSR